MHKVFVTGATGFVGSHLVDFLLDRGDEVYCLVRQSSSLQWLEKKDVTLVYGGLGQKMNEEVKAALKEADYVYHIAAAIKGLKKKDFFNANVTGTQNLLEAIEEAGGKLQKFILLSSIAASGPGLFSFPVNEEKKTEPVSWYGESKLASEKITLKYQQYFPVTILRAPPVYGPRDYGMLDLYKCIKCHFIPLLGKPMRTNFVYVGDLIKGLILAAESPAAEGEIFNIGFRENMNTLEAMRIIAKVMHKKVIKLRIPLLFLYIAAALSELKMKITKKPELFSFQKIPELKQTNWMLDITKARQVLNYEPQTEFEEGCKITYQWYKEAGWL